MLIALFAVPAEAQQASPSSTNLTPQELAKSVHNPFEDFVKDPIEVATGFNAGTNHSAGVDVNLEPVVPFALNAQWDLIARPSSTVASLPSPNSQFGLSDTQTLLPDAEKREQMDLGSGANFSIPDRVQHRSWQRKMVCWTGAVIYSNGPWFNGILAYQLMSFAGPQHRGSVNQTYLEPDVSYNLDNGWYGQIDPPISYHWTAEKRNAWAADWCRPRQRVRSVGTTDESSDRIIRLRETSRGPARMDDPGGVQLAIPNQKVKPKPGPVLKVPKVTGDDAFAAIENSTVPQAGCLA
jgi:hypothetical protein